MVLLFNLVVIMERSFKKFLNNNNIIMIIGKPYQSNSKEVVELAHKTIKKDNC